MGFFHAVTEMLGYWSSALVCGLLVMAVVFGLVLLRPVSRLVLTTLLLVAGTGLVLWWLGYLPVRFQFSWLSPHA